MVEEHLDLHLADELVDEVVGDDLRFLEDFHRADETRGFLLYQKDLAELAFSELLKQGEVLDC